MKTKTVLYLWAILNVLSAVAAVITLVISAVKGELVYAEKSVFPPVIETVLLVATTVLSGAIGAGYWFNRLLMYYATVGAFTLNALVGISRFWLVPGWVVGIMTGFYALVAVLVAKHKAMFLEE